MSTPTTTPAICPLCGAGIDLLFKDLTGYREGSTYDIYACEGCEARLALPLRSDPETYQFIYDHAAQIPGYNRYLLFAQTIAGLKGRDALDYLSSREPTYFPFHTLFPSPQARLKVLEIGSGLGYLTYALNEAGIPTTGVDISASAVEQATERFGPHYRQCDILNDAPGDD
ncbi:MAG: class I SAM-dependent methyltransferase, partial [Planctomycetota bacterium]